MGVGSTFTSAARESLGELGQSGKGEPGISEQPRLARRSLSTSLIHPTRTLPFRRELELATHFPLSAAFELFSGCRRFAFRAGEAP